MISPRKSFISFLGYTLVGGPPERFSEFIRSETESGPRSSRRPASPCSDCNTHGIACERKLRRKP